MKIVLLEEKTVTQGDVSLKEFYELGEVVSYPLTPQERLVEYIGDAEAAICNKTVFTREVIESCPKLRYIGLCATGYNNIDLQAASDHNITICNVPAYSTNAVAQQVFSYILHFASRTADYNADVQSGGWIRSDTFSYFTIPTYELAGMTLGIIGFGSIGSAAARIAQAFGMKVIAYTRTPKQAEGVTFVSLEEVFATSDFITLHCPLNSETENLVCMDRLKLCKPSAVIINTSRGPVVNENDLALALNSGIIAGAGLDVVSAEPMKADNPLLGAKNCIITPHVSWAPVQTRQRLIKIAADNLRCFINGTPQNKVNR
ncbi:MAG: D-2-hydroxyacid dehydrogenase [Huintestinicola sp.]